MTGVQTCALPIYFLPVDQGYTFHLRPVLADTELKNFIKALVPAAYSFAGFDILWFAYPYLKNKEKSKIGVIAAVSVITLSYAAITIATLMVFGVERLAVIYFPTVSLAGITELLLFERLDSLAFFVWLATVSLTGASQVYISARLVEGAIPKVTLNKAAAFLGGFLVIMSLGEYPSRLVLHIADLFGTFDFIFIAASAVVLPVVAYLKLRRGKKSAQA